jgi:two-component system, OmpR family, response regulator VicR
MMSKKKIVLAEDNSTLSLLLKFRLEKEGYELFIAVDGKEALQLIETHEPDLI